MPRGLPAVTLLLLLSGAALLTPAAAGQDASLNLTFTGDLRLPPDALVEGRALGLFVPDTTDLATLDVTAPTATIHTFRTTYACAPGLRVATGGSTTSYPLTDVRVSLATPPGSGWVGVYPTAADISWRAPAATLRPSSDTKMGNEKVPETTPSPAYPYYSRAFTRPHLNVSASGVFDLTGDFAVKALGPEIRVQASENTTHLQTGSSRSAGLACQEEVAWTHITFENAHATLSNTGPAHLALAAVDVAWRGAAVVRSAHGTITTADAQAPLDAPALTITGDVQGRVTPRDVDGRPGASLTSAGSFQGAPLDTLSVSAPSPVTGQRLGVWAAVGVVALAAAVVAVKTRPQPTAAVGLTFEEFREGFTVPGWADYYWARLIAPVPGRKREAQDHLLKAYRADPELHELHDPDDPDDGIARLLADREFRRRVDAVLNELAYQWAP